MEFEYVDVLINSLLLGKKIDIVKIIGDNYDWWVETAVPSIKNQVNETILEDKKIKTISTEKLPEIQTKRPYYAEGLDRFLYRKQVFDYLKEVPRMFRLQELNEIQKNVAFTVIDPERQVAEEFVYGPGDFLRFVAEVGNTDTENILIRKTNNPLYAPMRYEIPDMSFNNIVRDLQSDTDPSRIFSALARTLAIFDGIQPNEKDERIRVIIRVLDFIKKLRMLKYDPITLSKLSKEQTRPMENYIYENFNDILQNFDKKMSKRIKNLGIQMKDLNSMY